MATAVEAKSGRARAWLRPSWVGPLLAAGILLATLNQIVHERHDAIENARSRAELMARVLDDQVARTFDAASMALASLAPVLGAEADDASPRIGLALSQSLASLPQLRALAVVDTRGRVLASTDAADVGAVVALDALGPLPGAARDQVGRFVPGRGLGALVPGRTPQAPAGVGFVPVVRRLETARPALLVGLVNPDAIANHQTLTLGGDGVALLATLDGQVIAATGGAAAAPGAVLRALPALDRFREGDEHGSVVEPGLAGAQAVVAHRVARHRPLLTLVELPMDQALSGWFVHAQWLLGTAALAVAVVLAMTVAAARAARLRDQAQSEVAAGRHELGVLVASIRELIFRTDAQGRVSYLSPRWAEVSTLAADEALGRPLPELVAEASREAALRLVGSEAAAAGDGVRRTVLAFPSSGAARQYEVHLSPLTEAGRTVGHVGSAVDITERLASQEQLRQQLAITERLLEVLPLPVLMRDARGRCVLVNQAWEAMTGLSREDVLAKPVLQFMAPGEAELHQRHDRELLAPGAAPVPLRFDLRTEAVTGKRRELVVTQAAVPGPDGRPAGVLTVYLDVTEQRRGERAVREARDAAEEASRSKSEFIANISHELRTPLQSIIGFSEIGEHRGQAVSPRLATMFGDIHRAGQRMLALVEDLLDVSRIESTVGTFHLERADLRPLVRDVVRELEPLLSRGALHAELALGEWPLVAKVDPLRLQQVFRNVLANAIRYSPRDTVIDICGELTADNRIRVSVRDHGPGIPEAELEKIFEAFVQSSRTKDGSGGTGLGLAICRKILQAHGGSIGAANAEGGGSIFRIELPARGFAETQAAAL